MIKAALKQVFRAPIRLILCLILLTACTLLCGVSWHLYDSTVESAKYAKEVFSTTVVIEAAYDEELQYDSELVKYLHSSPYVSSYDMRIFMSAYCPQTEILPLEYKYSDPLYMLSDYMLFRCTIEGDGPVDEEMLYEKVYEATITELIYTRFGEFKVQVGDKILISNYYRVAEDLTTYQDWLNGECIDWDSFKVGEDLYIYSDMKGEAVMYPKPDDPDVYIYDSSYAGHFRGCRCFKDRSYIENIAKLSDMTFRSVAVCATNDISSMLICNQKRLDIIEGRMLDKDESDKVCLVSSQKMQDNGWVLGQRIDLSFYLMGGGTPFEKGTPLLEDSSIGYWLSKYIQNEYGAAVIDSGEYTIVGVYSTDMTEGSYGIDLETVFVPIKSINYDFAEESKKGCQRVGIHESEIDEGTSIDTSEQSGSFTPETDLNPIKSTNYDNAAENEKRLQRVSAYELEAEEEPSIIVYYRADARYNTACFMPNWASVIIDSDSVEQFTSDLGQFKGDLSWFEVTVYDQGYKYVSAPLQGTREVAILLLFLSGGAVLLVSLLFVGITLQKNKDTLRIQKSLGAGTTVQRSSMYVAMLPILIASCVLGMLLCGILSQGITKNVYEEQKEVNAERIDFSLETNYAEGLRLDINPLTQGNGFRNSLIGATALISITTLFYSCGVEWLLGRTVVQLKKKE